MKGRRASYAVGWNGLYYRATLDLFLEVDDMRFVSGLANVGFVGLTRRYWRLRRERYVSGLEDRDCGAKVLIGAFVGRWDGGRICRGRRHV